MRQFNRSSARSRAEKKRNDGAIGLDDVGNVRVLPRRTKFVAPPGEYVVVEDVDWTAVPVNELAPEPLTSSGRLMPSDSEARKRTPITTGVIDYFPDALTAIAEVSWLGNQKHNPGEPMHWSRGKSNDHADCVARHLIERGTRDDKGVRHSAQLAWRALALLQEELEIEAGLMLPRGATSI